MGQGRKGLEVAVGMARGEELSEQAVYIPFELVNAQNADEYLAR